MSRVITDEDYVNILSGAFSGGCDYWCEDVVYSKEEYNRCKSCAIGKRE